MRIVCVSDTHTMLDKVQVPDGDILIHAGDFTYQGYEHEVKQFAAHLDKLPHPTKIVIAGNHDMSFQHSPEKARGWLGNSCIYLEDSLVEVEGLKIYGAPWQPYFCNWAFNLRFSHQLKEKWDLIPEGIDILVTHGPPNNILDLVPHDGRKVGCVDLAEAVSRVKPKLHIFGHIHEGYGQLHKDGTTYINASSCTGAYKPTNPPIVIDL
jgi:Icc-related predicted phosphoesterase